MVRELGDKLSIIANYIAIPLGITEHKRPKHRNKYSDRPFSLSQILCGVKVGYMYVR